jgi:hypothetical protein
MSEKFSIQSQALAETIGNGSKETAELIQSQLIAAYNRGMEDRSRQIRDLIGAQGDEP